MATMQELSTHLTQLKASSDELSQRLMKTQTDIAKQGQIIAHLTQGTRSGQLAAQQMNLSSKKVVETNAVIQQLSRDCQQFVQEIRTQ